jgi:pimeloyl-ACP methyl ester carboxylesterase
MGGGIALGVAAEDAGVDAVVADGTIGRVIDGLIGLGRAKGIPAPLMIPPAWAIVLLASLRARAWIPAADPMRWAGRTGCPVLFVHGADDPFNTPAGARALAGLAPRGQLWIMPGAAHRDAYRRESGRILRAGGGFFAERL